MPSEYPYFALKNAVSANNPELIASMLREMDLSDPDFIMRAAYSGNAPLVGVLLAAGADPNAREPKYLRTPIFFAAERGHIEVVKQLLSSGADPSARGKFGCTALMWAAKKRHREIVSILEEAMRVQEEMRQDARSAINKMQAAGNLDTKRPAAALRQR